MNDIQKARDVLKKWRGHPLKNADDEAATRLIVGTAGNPELLDAIDMILEVAYRPGASGAIRHHAANLAAAIIAADEQMQQ